MKTKRLNILKPDFADLALSVLQTGSALRFSAGGQSMTPCIAHGDVVTISPEKENLTIGKIVACLSHNGDALFIHRIVGKKNDKFILKGDNAFIADGLFSKEHILGSVSKIERRGRTVRFGLGKEGLILALLVRFNVIRLWNRVWNKTDQSEF